MSIDGGLRPLFHKHVRGVMWVAVETGMTSGGVPDSWYIAPDAVQGWVEYKREYPNKPAIRFRPEQVGWLGRCARYGGRCYVAVRALDDRLLVYRGADAGALQKFGLGGAPPLLSLPGGPRRWNWDAVWNTIVGG